MEGSGGGVALSDELDDALGINPLALLEWRQDLNYSPFDFSDYEDGRITLMEPDIRDHIHFQPDDGPYLPVLMFDLRHDGPIGRGFQVYGAHGQGKTAAMMRQSARRVSMVAERKADGVLYTIEHQVHPHFHHDLHSALRAFLALCKPNARCDRAN